jgi:cobalt-zinc-cadmium efflux system outer membrane protein
MNIHKHSVLIISFILLWSFKGLTQENDKTLNDYLILAAENNPGLRATFNDYMAAMEKVPQAGTLPDPQFAFGYFINPVETRLGPQKATFGLQQAFPWFGSLSAREDASSELAKAAYEVFENKKSNLYFEVKTAFYNYYFMEKAIQITKDNIEILRIFKNLSLVKIEAGNASIIDELRVEMELNDLENQLALFIDSKTVFQSKFNNLLNRDPAELIESPEKIWNDELPYEKMTLLDSIYNNNHELKSMDHKLTAFMNQEIAAKKEGLPKFNLGINYILVGENPNSNDPNNGKDALLFPSVGLSIPIYRKKYKAMINESRYLQASEIAKKEDKRNSLHTVFENALKDFNDGHRRILLNNRQSEIANKVLDVLITSYATNSRDFEEVLRIERQLLGYKLAEQKASIDKNAAVAFIQYMLGN